MKVATASLFVAILVNPLPGGGKIPAITQAESFNMGHSLVLALVLASSLLQIALYLAASDLIKRLAGRLIGRFRRGPQRPLRVPQFKHPGSRYGLVAALPLLPAGGGMLWSIGLCHAWELDRRACWILISISNSMSFVFLYLLAGSLGLLTFGLGLAVLATGWCLAKWLRPRIHFLGYSHA